MPKKLVNISTAAAILAVSPDTLRYWDKIGKLSPLRNKNNRYRLYDISKLQNFAEKEGLNMNSLKNRLVKD